MACESDPGITVGCEPSRSRPTRPLPGGSLPGRMTKAGLVLGTAFALSGCATSGAMTLLSFGVSGVSLAVSGKSLTDHALSVVLNRDCALWRPVNGDAVCRRSNSSSAALALGAARLEVEKTNPSQPLPIANSLRDSDRPYGIAGGRRSALAVTRSAMQPIIGARPLAVENTWRARTFAVLGSFKERDNAQRLAGRIGNATNVQVLTTELAMGVRHRVVLGPVDAPGMTFHDEMAQRGITEAWPLSLCVRSLRPPPCVEPRRLLAVAR